jgi:drug/metabolite transporter (DMT)-like permease
MNDKSSATPRRARPLPVTAAGPAWGLLGVVAFSFTVPFTRVADGGLAPLFIGSARAVVAAALAIGVLGATRSRSPHGSQWARLAVVGGGIVVGFPLLTSYALTHVPASHGAVVIALLPAATAVTVVLRTGEQPALTFWLAAAVGAAAAVAFSVAQSGGLEHLEIDDLLLIGAVIAAAIGYAEGGLLARELGSWQTVSWTLVLCAPLMTSLTIASIVVQPPSASLTQWAALAYLCVVSMYLGYFAWYRGLAIGPMAQVSQVQLTQPALSILWSALLLGETVGRTTVIGGAVVVLSAAIAVRARLVAPEPAAGRNEGLRGCEAAPGRRYLPHDRSERWVPAHRRRARRRR